MQDAMSIVKSFYTDSLTVNQGGDPATTMNRVLADNYESLGSVDSKTKAQLIGQMQYIWKVVPNLKWEVQEILQDGNRFVVRSIATGTPNGDFMGVPTNGSQSFKMQTIDIHTVENNQIVRVYHVEDWTTAMKQLRS